MSNKAASETDRQVGARIRARRVQRGMSQQKLADALGITFPQVQKYENGKNRVTIGRLQRIGEVLGVPGHMIMAEVTETSGVSNDESLEIEQRRAAAAISRLPPERRAGVAEVLERMVEVIVGTSPLAELAR